VAGQVFRALRTWHEAPSECEVCLQELGQVLGGPERCAADEASRQPVPRMPSCWAARQPCAWQQCPARAGPLPRLVTGPLPCAEPLPCAAHCHRYACTAPKCDKSYADYQSYANHCAMQGHPINYTVCAGCGRIGRLA
jgi:hypothetical protein